jgi:methanogenic corrinoid protein MtbC1
VSARGRDGCDTETQATALHGFDQASPAALDEQGALAAVTARIDAGDDPFLIVEDCRLGMRRVGEHSQSGGYCVSGLILAGAMFREAMVTPGSVLPAETEGTAHGIVLMATACDLDVAVAPEEIARRTRDLRPDITGLSGPLTSAAACP